MLILFIPNFIINKEISNIVIQAAFVLNFFGGMILFSKSKKIVTLFLVAIVTILFILDYFYTHPVKLFEYIKAACYFTFYFIVSYELIKQVVRSKVIDRNVIIGLMCGYTCIGLIGFSAFYIMEFLHPGSFNGIDSSLSIVNKKDSLMYFSYISLLTIGFGDISPATTISQKVTVLIGLIGQFYMVILTAIIVGKYIGQLSDSDH